MLSKPMKKWIGRRVISTRTLANAYGSLPSGTPFFIDDVTVGFRISSFPCAHCGVKLSFSKVRPDALAPEAKS